MARACDQAAQDSEYPSAVYAVFIRKWQKQGIVTSKAYCDAAAWPEHVRVAVNLSPAEFQAGDLIEMISQALLNSRLPAAR